MCYVETDLKKRGRKDVSKIIQFFIGWMAILLCLHLILFNGFCLYYGFSGLVGVALISLYMHATPLPYLLYLLGGIGFCFTKQENSLRINWLWGKWLMIVTLLSLIAIIVSEIAHTFGWLEARFSLNHRIHNI